MFSKILHQGFVALSRRNFTILQLSLLVTMGENRLIVAGQKKYIIIWLIKMEMNLGL